jgi:hypothetical protein
VIGDVEPARFLQQWAGYCLTGITREHALVFVYGPGDNGKSVFIDVLTRIVADYGVTAAMETLRHPCRTGTRPMSLCCADRGSSPPPKPRRAALGLRRA